jgi:hypothetical protein
MEEIKQKILVALIGEDPEDWEHYDYDCVVWFYSQLEERLGILKKEIQPKMIELRNEGLVELIRGLISEDESGYYGSGWVLTPKGLIEAKKYVANNKQGE